MRAVIDEQTDRFFVLNLDRRAPVRTLGIGAPPVDPPVFFIT
ncbi:CRISPR-associated Cas2 family protein [Thioalkalivibrio nitratireducens DSM 14787]|uniref:CRISPR-associated Cas2 family protein n=1 Tax=Thioalkalivibrio nitratireducens (strain DSM 14787 / UNIQEM 213 / ALEN2) TaxID=1255043 RepID=L0DVS7_THIND|nr:CRISPR-associated Cas2 family protein [Thioalkalivibrio nitratireducens DSM 14787]